MFRDRLTFIFSLALLSSSCSVKEEVEVAPRGSAEAQASAGILVSSLQVVDLLSISTKFLEWHKGYSIQIQDPDRGFMVTEWVKDSAYDRHRVTLRVVPNDSGSVLSTHIVQQQFNGRDWLDIPVGESMKAHMVAELREYVRNSVKSRPSGVPEKSTKTP